jgi:hypothetical protein
MLIILEGVDGAGKSTLASAIIEKIQKLHPEDTVEYLHASQIKGTVYEEYVEPLSDYQPGSGRHIVIDRWHVGERIYGPLYRDSSAFDAAIGSFAWIELFLASKGARLWNVTQELEVLQKRLAERGEDFLEDRHVELVRDRFIEETKESMLFAGSVSPDGNWTATYAQYIVDDAEFGDFRAMSLQSHGVKSYLGQTYVDPTTVLIVDNKSKNLHFHPDNSDEAAIFLSSIRQDVINGLAIVSSVSQSALQELVERLSMSGIVTYSETVSARLNAAGINHIKFDEPVAERGYPVKFYLAAEKAQDLD